MHLKRTMKRLLTILTVWLFATAAFGQWGVAHTDSLPTPRERMATVAMDGIAYFIGGNEQVGDITMATDEVLRYDLANLEWLEPAPPLLLPRIGATAVEYQGKIFVIGGRSESDGGYIEHIEVWWPDRNFWAFADSLEPARDGARAVVYHDSLLVTGGYRGADEYLNDVVMLTPDSSAGSIQVTPVLEPLLEPLASHGAAVLNDNLYVFGGFYFGPQLKSRMYDPDSGWVNTQWLPVPLGGMGVANAVVDNQECIVFSGGRSILSEVDMAMMMDSSGTWTELPLTLSFGRAFHSMVAIPNDSNSSFLVAGGSWTQEGSNTRYLTHVVEVLEYGVTAVVQEPREELPPPSPSLKAWPNPFNGGVRIDLSRFQSSQSVQLVLFNTLGQQVRQWDVVPAQTGGAFAWDGSLNGVAAPAGVYFLRAEQNNQQATIKLVRIP